MLGITFSPQNYHHHQQFLSKLRENNENDMTSVVWAVIVFGPSVWLLSAQHNQVLCVRRHKTFHQLFLVVKHSYFLGTKLEKQLPVEKFKKRKIISKNFFSPIIFREETFLLVKPECANASFASTEKVFLQKVNLQELQQKVSFGWSDSMIFKKIKSVSKKPLQICYC